MDVLVQYAEKYLESRAWDLQRKAFMKVKAAARTKHSQFKWDAASKDQNPGIAARPLYTRHDVSEFPRTDRRIPTEPVLQP